MNCLYLSQELAPYFTEGGLGLTAAGLPAAIQQSFGIDHTIFIPYYPHLAPQSGLQTEVVDEQPPISVGGRLSGAKILRAINYPGPCEVLLLWADSWYKRDGGIYRDRHYIEYDDAVLRAAFYGLCVTNWLTNTPDRFSIVHANDWQSGMALFLINQIRRKQGSRMPALIYNIHSGEYQGLLDLENLNNLGLNNTDLVTLQATMPKQPSLMLLGMLAADALATCSPTYGRELHSMLSETPMEEPLLQRGITGIVSGVDAHIWDPTHLDSPLTPYTAETVVQGKRRNKRVLQRRLGFVVKTVIPVYCICTRLVPHKGIDLLLEVLPEFILAKKIQLVVMGTGLASYRDAFRDLAERTPTAVAYYPQFDQTLARLFYAGSDFTLMPSQVEPCGLNQLIAMGYGTLPIVSKVGGLNDTVIDLCQAPVDGTGFVFKERTSVCLRTTIEHSLCWLHKNPMAVCETRRRAMKLDWSWQRTAKEFATFYHNTIEMKKKRRTHFKSYD